MPDRCLIEGTRVRRGLEIKFVFAMAEESMVAWYRGVKTLWRSHGNGLIVDLGKKAEPTLMEGRLCINIRQ